MGNRVRALLMAAAVATTAMGTSCAPILRDVDADGLRHTQQLLSEHYSQIPEGDPQRLVVQTAYCELDAVLVAADQKTGPLDDTAPLRCGAPGGSESSGGGGDNGSTGGND